MDKRITDYTAQEILEQAFEEFSKSEGQRIVIVFTDNDGNICTLTNASHHERIGLCEYAKEGALRNMYGD